jgi:RNA polymerase sigma-70 factor (ECF subfamily)
MTYLTTTPTTTATGTVSAGVAGALDADSWMAAHRPPLVAHCRRMLRSAADADDAAQETLIRAWRSYGRFEGRSSLHSWLRRIATNVCLDMIWARDRRPEPVAEPDADPGAPVGDDDPADRLVARETLELAFVAALAHLPPRQRAALVLCDVLRWRAVDVAELLGTTVPSITSALQRARATLADHRPHRDDAPRPGRPGHRRPPGRRGEDQRALAQELSAAFARYDVAALTSLLGSVPARVSAR